MINNIQNNNFKNWIYKVADKTQNVVKIIFRQLNSYLVKQIFQWMIINFKMKKTNNK
jgi:hypothetical protein